MEIHTRAKSYHFGRYLVKAKVFCRKCFVPVTGLECSHGKILIPVTEISVAKTEISVMYRSIPKPPMPPRANPRAFDFFEKFWSNSPLCCQLSGQMPHPLELQRGSNPSPSRHVKAAVETSSAKISATTNFLFTLSSLHTLNKGIFHDITI